MKQAEQQSQGRPARRITESVSRQRSPCAPLVCDPTHARLPRNPMSHSAQLDSDHFAEVRVAVVEAGDGLRVGYWSQGAY